MLRYVFPRISWADLRWMLGIAAVGAVLAGMYGVLHDQITYAISPEYFTKLKFQQFDYADLGLGDRALVVTIGFLATWWVGFIAAWFVARLVVPGRRRAEAMRHFAMAAACLVIVAFGAGVLAYLYGLWRGPDIVTLSWKTALRQLGIVDREAFVRVAIIHSASYVGGLLGFLLALVWSCRSVGFWSTRLVAGNPDTKSVH